MICWLLFIWNIRNKDFCIAYRQVLMIIKRFIKYIINLFSHSHKADCSQYNIDLSDIAFEDGSTFTPKCPSHREYVCASNGRTFTSECQLCSYMEIQKGNNSIIENKSPLLLNQLCLQALELSLLWCNVISSYIIFITFVTIVSQKIPLFESDVIQ